MSKWTDRIKSSKTNKQIIETERQVWANLRDSGLSHEEIQKRVNAVLVSKGLIKR